VAFLDVNQERHQAYSGYDGVVALAAEIDRVVSNPVFDTVRRPAPWNDHQQTAGPGSAPVLLEMAG
jgi:nitrogenase molybdenum-cofactor synthesis protein NifE